VEEQRLQSSRCCFAAGATEPWVSDNEEVEPWKGGTDCFALSGLLSTRSQSPGWSRAEPWADLIRAFSAGTESQDIQSGSAGGDANL